MSTQKQTTQTNQFDQGSMNAYQGIAGSLGKFLPSVINKPFSGPFYQMTRNKMMQDANLVGGQNMSNLAQSFRTSGMGGSAGQGFMQAQTAKTGRSNSALTAGAGQNAIMSALQRQMQGAQLGTQFQPLQTGASATQKTGGLGTWLPQVVGAGLSGAMALGTGGMSSMLPGLMSAGGMGLSGSTLSSLGSGMIPGLGAGSESGLMGSIMSGAGGGMPSFGGNPMALSGMFQQQPNPFGNG